MSSPVVFTTSFVAVPDPVLNAFGALAYLQYIASYLAHVQLSALLLSVPEQLALVPPFTLEVNAPEPTPEDLASSVTYARYADLRKEFVRRRDLIAAIRLAIMMHADESTRRRWRGLAPHNVIDAVSVYQLLTWFKTFHLEFSAHQVQLLPGTLEIPFVHGRTVLEEHLLFHANVHELAALNGQPWRDTQRISCLRASLLSCPLFTFAFQTWDQTRPDIRDQVYLDFVDVVYRAFRASSSLTHVPCDLSANASMLPKSAPSMRSVPAPAAVPGDTLPTFYYCYTHGFQYTHWSATCACRVFHHIETEWGQAT